MPRRDSRKKQLSRTRRQRKRLGQRRESHRAKRGIK